MNHPSFIFREQHHGKKVLLIGWQVANISKLPEAGRYEAGLIGVDEQEAPQRAFLDLSTAELDSLLIKENLPQQAEREINVFFNVSPPVLRPILGEVVWMPRDNLAVIRLLAMGDFKEQRETELGLLTADLSSIPEELREDASIYPSMGYLPGLFGSQRRRNPTMSFRNLFLKLHALAPNQEGWLGYVFNIVLVAGGARTATLLQTIDFPRGMGNKLVKATKKILKSYKDVRFLKNYQGYYIYKRNKRLPTEIITALDEGDDEVIGRFLDFVCIYEFPGGDYTVAYNITYKDVEDNFISYGCYKITSSKKKTFKDLLTSYREFADTLNLGIKIDFELIRNWSEEELIALLKSKKSISEDAMGGINNIFWNWGFEPTPDNPSACRGMQIIDALPENKRNYRSLIKQYIPAWIEAIQLDEAFEQIYEDYGYTRKAKQKAKNLETELYQRHGLI